MSGRWGERGRWDYWLSPIRSGRSVGPPVNRIRHQSKRGVITEADPKTIGRAFNGQRGAKRRGIELTDYHSTVLIVATPEGSGRGVEREKKNKERKEPSCSVVM